MFTASIGGGNAARWRVYRHALVRLMMPSLAPLGAGKGWSALSLALCSILMSWDASPTLAQRFEAALGVLDAALPRRRRTGRTYQGFIKALTRHGSAASQTLGDVLRIRCKEAAGRHWTFGGLVPIGADGSKFNAPRTIGNEALGIAGRDRCGPQMMTLLLVHLGAMLPWGWKIAGVGTGERALLREAMGLLPKNTLLVTDAGFTGFDLLRELQQRGAHFLIRVGSGTYLLKELGYYRREGKHGVCLWPDQRRHLPPLRLRLIKVGSVYLITDVTDPRVLSRATASELYRRRWGLEVAFRTLKQTLEHRAVRSGTATHALAELNWAVLGLQMLMVLGVNAIRAGRHHPPLLSVARCLSAVRAAFHRQSHAALVRRLSTAVLDGYERHASKHAYRPPRKRTPTPPGEPTVIKATAAQIRAAQRLHAQSAPE